MAEQQNEAVFTDVLNIQASPQAFAESLNLLLREYQSFLAKIGEQNAGAVAATGLGNLISESFSSIEGSIAKVALAVEQFTTTNTTSAKKAVSDNEAVAESVEKIVVAQKKINEAAQAKGVKLARDIDIEQEGTVNKSIELEEKAAARRLELARNIEIEQEGIANRQQKLLEREAATKLALARGIEIEQEGLINKAQVAEEASAKKKLDLARTIALEQEGISNKANEVAERQAARERARQERIGAEMAADIEKRIALEQKLQSLKVFQGQRAAESAFDKEAAGVRRLSTELEKAQARIQAAQERLQFLDVGTKPAERIQFLNAQLELTKARLDALRESSTFGPLTKQESISPENISKQKELANLLGRQAALTGQINSAQKELDGSSKTFLDRFSSGWAQSASHLVRVSLLFAAINTAVEVLTKAIKAPFEIIYSGVKYLQEVERAATELAVPLEANVEFSKDLGENLRISNEVAKELLPLLQSKSLESGLPLQQLENVFKALVGSGATQSVRNVKDLATFAEGFAIVLEASGRNALSINGEIANLSKLFSGVNTQSSLFLQTLKIAPSEWEKILKSSKEHGDLLKQLAPKIEPYLDAAHKVGLSQQNLISQLELLINQLKGAGAVPVFEYLNTIINNITTTLKENEPIIIRNIRLIGDWILEFAKLFETFFKISAVQYSMKGFFIIVGGALDLIRNAAVVTIATLQALFKITTDPLSTGDTLKTYNEQLAESGRLTKEFFKIAIGSKDELNSGTSTNPFNEDKGLLKATFNPKPGPDLTKSTVSNVKARFDLEEEQYKQSVANILRIGDKFRKETESQAVARQISFEQAGDKIHKILEAESFAILLAEDAFKKAAAVYRQQIEDDKKLIGPEKELALLRFDNNVKAQLEIRRNAEAKGVTEEKSIRDKGARERNQVEDAEFRARLALEREFNQAKLAQTNALYSAGYLNQVEFVDKKAALAKEDFEIQKEIIDAELIEVENSPVKYAVALGKRQQAEQKYTEQVKQFSLERTEALLKEQLQLEAFGDASRALSNQQLQSRQDLRTSLFGDSGFSSAQQELLDVQFRELEILRQQKLAHLEEAIAKNTNSQATKDLLLDVQRLDNAERLAFSNRIKQIQQQVSDPTFRQVLTNIETSRERGRLTNARDFTLARSSQLASNLQGARLEGNELVTAEVQALIRQLQTFGAQTDSASKALSDFASDTQRDRKKALEQFADKFLGAGFTQSLRLTNDELLKNKDSTGKVIDANKQQTLQVQKAATITAGLANAFVFATDAFNQIRQGYIQGGVVGAIGSAAGIGGGILSSLKGIKGIAESVPIIGGVVSALSPVLSIIGGLFTAQAKKIGEQVKKSFSDTVTAFQNGNKDLADTIIELQQQRADVVRRLSGKKGGQDQLNQILPQFDQQIEQLLKQQRNVISAFETQLSQLILHNEAVSNINRQWVEINRQVKEYIGAGGDAVRAAEFLSLSLRNIQESANEALREGQEQAIQDAINLNNLLEQRNKLNQDFEKQLFDLQNADSLERRQAGSVSRGREIDELKKRHKTELDNINSQIDLATKKVEKEREVFTIATDTATLRADSNRLTLEALDRQIEKYRELQRIASSITIGEGGNYTGTGVFAPQITVNVTSNGGDPNAIGDAVSDAVTQALDDANRQGSPY